MSRDGFGTFTTDSSWYESPRWRKLRRALHDDPHALSDAVTIYWITMSASFLHGARLTAYDLAPDHIADIVTPISALDDAGLLDDAGRIADEDWQLYFGEAVRNRLALQRGRRYGGLVSRGRSKEEANAMADAAEAEQLSKLGLLTPRLKERALSAGLEQPASNPRLEQQVLPNSHSLTPSSTRSPGGGGGGGAGRSADGRLKGAPTAIADVLKANGAAGPPLPAPSHPPVRMNRLDESTTEAIEVELRRLSDGRNDPRIPKLRAELAARAERATDDDAEELLNFGVAP